jgi:hypothetical protein
VSVANSSARPGTQPTRAELRVLAAWKVAVGRDKAEATARDLGMTTDGVKAMLANVRARAGVQRTWEAVLRYLG